MNELLAEIARLRLLNKRNTSRLSEMRRSRDLWRHRALQGSAKRRQRERQGLTP